MSEGKSVESRGGIFGTLPLWGWCNGKPERWDYMSQEKVMYEMDNARVLTESRAAVAKFANGWQVKIRTLARMNIDTGCGCLPRGNPDNELSHKNPDCFIAVLLRLGRLIAEEGEEQRIGRATPWTG